MTAKRTEYLDGATIKFYEKSFVIDGQTVFYNGGENWEKQLADAIQATMNKAYAKGQADVRNSVKQALAIF